MPKRDIEIVVRGGSGSATAAAYVAARALEAEGVFVNVRSPVGHSVPPLGPLRGVRALVHVEDAEDNDASAGAPLIAERERGGWSRAAKLGIGVVLLLMLFGAEVSLQFGFRLDTIFTLLGLWVFWHSCLRSRKVLV